MESGGDQQRQLEQIRIQLRELTEANAALTRRVFALEQQVSRNTIAEAVEAPAMPIPPPPLPPPPMMAADPQVEPALPPQPRLIPQQPAEPPVGNPETPTLESNVGLTWINRIGVVTVLLGVAFFFKYAVDNDWIGPGGRVILGVLAGLAAIFAGDRLWHRGQKTFAQGIQALGSSILYLSFFAAFSFYQLIPQAIAFVLMFATTLMTGALSLRYNARATLLLALLSGYATPFLLAKGEPNDLFFLSYMLVLNGAAMYVSRLRNWKSLETVSLAGTWILHTAWSADRARVFGREWGALFTILNYGICVISPNSWVALVAFFMAPLAVAITYQHHWAALFQPLLLGLLVGSLAVIWWKKRLPGGSAIAFLGFWFAQAAVDLPHRNEHVTELMLGYTISFAIVLVWTKLRAAVHEYSVPKSDLLTAAGAGVIYYGAAYSLLEVEYKDWLGLFTVAVAACYLALGYLLFRDTPAEKRDSTGPLLAAGLALAFLALAVPVQLTGFRITIGWAIQCAALTFIAYKLRDWRILIGAAALAFLAAGRLAGEDSLLYWPPLPNGASYTLFFNERFLTFLCVCVSLFLSAFWTSKMGGVVDRRIAAIPYLLAHVLLIWGIHLELFAYVDSRNDLLNRSSLKTLISSLIFAGYGFQFLVSGFARRSALPRILGLILFAIVIVKLYIYDIWLLDVTYRIIAFMALGGMLLAGSYMYSRFRDKLSTLIKDEE
jgi:hypothetical protein